MTYPQYPVGPGGYGPPPPRKSASRWKILAAMASVAMIALAAFVAAGFLVEKKRDSSQETSSTEINTPSVAPLPAPAAPDAGPRTHVIEGGEGWQVEAECLASGQPPEVCKQKRDAVYPPAAPAAPAAGLPVAGRESAFTQDLLDNPEVTIKDPGRLVSLGNATCRYLEAASGTPDSNAKYLEQFLEMRKISPSDSVAIVNGSLKHLCPQYAPKLEG